MPEAPRDPSRSDGTAAEQRWADTMGEAHPPTIPSAKLAESSCDNGRGAEQVPPLGGSMPKACGLRSAERSGAGTGPQGRGCEAPEKQVIIAVLAVRDARYYIDCSRQPGWPWQRTTLLSFNEIADQLCVKEGMPFLPVQKALRSIPERIDETATAEHFGRPPEAWQLLHEQVNNRLSAAATRLKFWRRLLAIESLLRDRRHIPVVQELGGFASILALRAWCRLAGTPHLSMEPGMFPGRLLFTRDSFFVDILGIRPDDMAIAKANQARRAFLAQPAFLMPEKDQLFFRAASLGKILSMDFLSRFWNKFSRAFLLRRTEEFSAIRPQTVEQLRRLLRSRRLRGSYSIPAQNSRFIYYPLHVPWDVQLTFRCPQCFDQMKLLERLTAALPDGWTVVTKEHPAAVGSYDVEPLRRLVAGRRLVLAPPHLNSLVLARQAQAVVTVNSKVGFESLMAGLPVITLGASFYRGAGLTTDVETPEQAVAAAVAGAARPDEERLGRFLGTCWAATVPGELYTADAAKLATSAAGFASAAKLLET